MAEVLEPDHDDYWGTAQPVLLGWLRDTPDTTGNIPVVEFAVERFNRLHRLDRKVELVSRGVQGAPAGRIIDVFATWHELRELGCLAILGPSISDACIEIRPVTEEFQVPTISSGATAETVGSWYFGVQHGSIPEEGYIIANWLVREGHTRVAVTYDTAYHAAEYLRHFRAAARRAGIDIVGERRISQLQTEQGRADAADAIARARADAPDAIVHLGTGVSGFNIAMAVLDAQWDVPRIMNDAFYIAGVPEAMPLFEGWVGIAGWDEENPVWAEGMQEFERWCGEPPKHPEIFAVWYTLAMAALEGIALAPVLSRDGIRRGLESVTMLPCAIGGPRTVVSFAPWNHRGAKGADVYVLRRIKDGKSVMEMRYDPTLAVLR